MPSRRRGRNSFKSGDWNVISDRSGFKHKASEMMKGVQNSKGLWVHKSEWDKPSGQYQIRPHPDDESVPETRVRPPDVFNDSVTADDL